MARTGLYKSEVKKARDALLAQSKHPSVDAVRIALGNTGSKTTIHKYLRELDEEEGATGGRQASISEALQDLVERLAAQLQDDANAQIDALRTEQAERERRHAATLAAVHQEIAQLSTQLQRTDATLQQEQAAHGVAREALQRETIARHTAEQHAADLKERLAENEAHRQSLEEKHKHARDALDHYRQSVKEQRDQDQRRHEQQVQQLQAEIRQLQQGVVVKQDEVTRLNQEGARLVSDLSHAQKALYDQQNHGRQLEQKLTALHTAEQRCNMLERQAADREAQVHDLKAQLAEATSQVAVLNSRIHDLQLALASAQARLEAQQTITAELHTYLKGKDASSSKENRPA